MRTRGVCIGMSMFALMNAVHKQDLCGCAHIYMHTSWSQTSCSMHVFIQALFSLAYYTMIYDICVCVYIYIYRERERHAYIRIYVCIYVYVYMYIYIYMYTYIHIYVYIHTYIHIYIYTYNITIVQYNRRLGQCSHPAWGGRGFLMAGPRDGAVGIGYRL